MTPRRSLLLVAALALLSVVAAGCGGDDEPVTFGEGEIPESVPDDIPVPDGAVVGSTLVDRVNHRTEFRLGLRQEADLVVQYYLVNLVSAGYVVDSSEGDATMWRIEFSRDTLRGSVLIQPGGESLTAAVVSVNRP